MRRRLIPFLAVIVALICVELCSYLLIAALGLVYPEPIRRKVTVYDDQRRLMQRILQNTGHIELDSVLGWRYRSGHRGPRDTINMQGLRSGRDYTAVPETSVTRVAAFGDSFVYGNEVGNDSSWASLAERAGPRLEILNYGVGGYGLDQAYLRATTEGFDLAPHVALIGFTTDDLRRLVNVYRRFISTEEIPLFKPRFIFDSTGALVFVPNPVPTRADYAHIASNPSAIRSLGRLDQWYQGSMYDNALYDYSATVRVFAFAWERFYRRLIDPERIWDGQSFNRQSDAYSLQLALFTQFVGDARSAGVKPLIVFLPDRVSVERVRTGEETLYDRLVQDVAALGLPHLDGIDAFRQPLNDADVSTLFAPAGHYSGRGNSVLAQWLRPLLLAMRP